MLWLLGPVVGIVVGFLALRWALGSHRRERAPWLSLLSGADPRELAVDGNASDGGGAISPIEAPFTGRKCIAFHIEIIVQEHFGNQVTWTRAFEDGVGRFFVESADGRRTEVDFAGGQMIFPPSLSNYSKLALAAKPGTIFEGTIDRAPPNLGWFVQRLPADEQQIVLRPSGQLVGGKRLYFNERIVVPGDKVVAAGPRDDEGTLRGTDHANVSLGFGNIDTERARIAKLPVASEAFGAVMGGIIALAVVEMLVGMISK